NVVEIHPILDITFNPAPGPPQPTPTTTTLIVQNPGFENGMQNWVASDGVITKDAREPARTGSWKAWLGGYGRSHTDTVYQRIAIPANAIAVTLSFYLHISTEEQSSTAYDTLKAQILSGSGQFKKTLATYSNVQASPGFHLKTLDLSPYIGQTIRIHFVAKEDNGSMTSFVLDDFRIVIE